MIKEIVLWYIDSGCSKHVIGQRDKLIDFVSKFISTIRFGNDHSATIMGYKVLQIRNILISRVYYMEGLGHNLFSIGQFCDSDLEVAFRKHTCFIRNLEGVNLLLGSRGSNLYTISLNDMMKSSPICLLSKASKIKSWLWHRRKSKKESHKPKAEPIMNEKLQMHMDLCGLIRVKFLRTKYETPEVIIKFLKQAQVSLQATVRYLRTENGTNNLNQTLRSYTKDVGITHQTSVARTPQQNDVVERRLVPNNAPSTSSKPPSKKDLDILFQPIFEEYFKPSPSVVSLTISAVTLPTNTAEETSLIYIDQDAPSPMIHLQFAPPDSSSAKSSSSRIVDTSNMHTFQQPYSHIRRYTKDYMLVIIIGNPSKPISTRRQLATDAMWCYFHAFLTKVKPKNYKEAMKEYTLIEAMQEEIHEFERLQVWKCDRDLNESASDLTIGRGLWQQINRAILWFNLHCPRLT
ncbi:retrovirus-related pol polyprotein from transposon TNT 1-94, partial [Tanacetum coccineum]